MVVNLDQSLVDEAIGTSFLKDEVNIFEHDIRYCGQTRENKIDLVQ